MVGLQLLIVHDRVRRSRECTELLEPLQAIFPVGGPTVTLFLCQYECNYVTHVSCFMSAELATEQVEWTCG